MMDQSILRAHRDRDDSIEKERRARVVKMMSKIYEVKITTKEKPFIHAMYENYHQKFCKKFKERYMQQARQAYRKAQQQGSLSKVFGKQSAISDHPPSTLSEQNNILEGLNQEAVKKAHTSEIRSKQIKKIEFLSEVKKQTTVNQMMKKKAPQEAENVSKIKEEPKGKQDVQEKKTVIKQINDIRRIQISKQASREIKKQEMPKRQLPQPPIVKQSPVNEIQIVKKVEQAKAQIKMVKQQAIKPSVDGEEEEQEQVEQDSGPSMYDAKMNSKMKQIDDPVKHVTSSQILPSKQDKSDIHAKSHIVSQQFDKRHHPNDAKQDKDFKEFLQKLKVDQQQQRIDKIVVETVKLEQNKDFVEQVKKQEKVLIEPQAENENKAIDPRLQEQKSLEKPMKSPQYIPLLQQLRQYLQDSSIQLQGQQESAFTLYTEPEVDRSKQEIPQESLDQAQPEQFSTELKLLHQNNHEKNEEQVPPQQIPKTQPQKAQVEDSEKPQIERKMELPSHDQTEITSKMEPKDIVERREQVQKLQSVEQKEEAYQFNDYFKNLIDRIVNSFQDWLDKELAPCEKCSKKDQQQSQKNPSDDQ